MGCTNLYNVYCTKPITLAVVLEHITNIPLNCVVWLVLLNPDSLQQCIGCSSLCWLPKADRDCQCTWKPQPCLLNQTQGGESIVLTILMKEILLFWGEFRGLESQLVQPFSSEKLEQRGKSKTYDAHKVKPLLDSHEDVEIHERRVKVSKWLAFTSC